MHVRDGHLPLHVEVARVMSLEHRVHAAARVREFDDVADADVGQVEHDRLAAIVDARVEVAFALQHLHLHVAQARDSLAVADDVQLRDDQRLPARIDLDLAMAQLVDALVGDGLADHVMEAGARVGREPHLVVDEVVARAVGDVGGVRLRMRRRVERHRLHPCRRRADSIVRRPCRRGSQHPCHGQRDSRRACAVACNHPFSLVPFLAPVRRASTWPPLSPLARRERMITSP